VLAASAAAASHKFNLSFCMSRFFVMEEEYRR
jgi:hypothetical protein